MHVSGQGKVEFESDLSTMFIKHLQYCGFRENVGLAAGFAIVVFKQPIKQLKFSMVLTRPWRIGVGAVWPVVILRLKH